jgi:hypothetical protein
MLHEVHNEHEPVPTNLAKTITTWVHRLIGETGGESKAEQSRL